MEAVTAAKSWIEGHNSWSNFNFARSTASSTLPSVARISHSPLQESPDKAGACGALGSAFEKKMPALGRSGLFSSPGCDLGWQGQKKVVSMSPALSGTFLRKGPANVLCASGCKCPLGLLCLPWAWSMPLNLESGLPGRVVRRFGLGGWLFTCT